MSLKRYGMDLLVAGLIYALGFLAACFWWQNRLHDLSVQVEDCQRKIQYYQKRDAESAKRAGREWIDQN
jgi:hypothetical protein